MPDLRSDDSVVAVLCADLHLCHVAPLARSGEPNWYGVMERQLEQLRDLTKEHNCPALCAGDIFDHWKSPPELVNFALAHLPPMVAVPGQHDLPFHNMDDLHKSAFWTLVEAERLVMATPKGIRGVYANLDIYGFGWGQPITPPQPARKGKLNVALIHEYTWVPGKGYKGAPDEAQVQLHRYGGYHVACIGDNHIPFERGKDGMQVFNCGGFFRRRADEVQHQPRVGLLHPNGTITSYPLDCQKDILFKAGLSEEDRDRMHTRSFLHEIQTLQTRGLSFREAINRALRTRVVPEPVRKCLLEALDGR